MTTSTVTTATTVTVSAAAGGVTRSANLTVNPPAQAAPTLRTPANGATAVPQPVALDWDDVPGATSYEVVVDDSSAMTSPFVSSSTVTVSQAAWAGCRGVSCGGGCGRGTGPASPDRTR